MNYTGAETTTDPLVPETTRSIGGDLCNYCWEDELGNPIPCENTPWVNKINELYWAWVSVCAGLCARIAQPLPWGWRFSTTDEWNAFLAEWDKRKWEADDMCANPHFDDAWVQRPAIFERYKCDRGDHEATSKLTNVENGIVITTFS